MFHPFSFWGIRPAILARMVKRDGMSFQPIGAGGRQAAFCAGQAALPEAGALPEDVFSPGLAFSRGLWGIFWGGRRPLAAIALVLCPARRETGGIRPEAAPGSGVRGGAGPMSPRFASRPPGAGRPHLTPHRPLPIMLIVVF